MSNSAESRISKKQMVLHRILAQGFVPILVNDGRDARQLVAAAVSAGCNVLECSCRRADARDMIPWIKREFPGVAILSATLVDSPRLERFLTARGQPFLTIEAAADLGADALVSFARFRPATYDRYGADFVMIPGIHSANEALDQIDLGADLVKATVLTITGREFIATVSGPMHRALPLFVSGGVTAENVATFIQQGIAVTAAGFDVLLPGGPTGHDDVSRLGSAAVSRMLASVRDARARFQPLLATAVSEGRTDVMSSTPWYFSSIE